MALTATEMILPAGYSFTVYPYTRSAGGGQGCSLVKEEDYVMNSEPPSNDEAHWQVVEIK
jgi:hypothetical protein